MRKKLLIILLTTLVFLSAVFLGGATVYRIDAVTLIAHDVSDAAKAEEQELVARLEQSYKGDNILFADRSEATKLLAEFPCLRLSGFKKEYPNRIVVEVTEDPEVYALQSSSDSGEYYILGETGAVLGVRDSYINRLDGEKNVLLQGVTVTGDRGEVPTGDARFAPMLAVCAKLSELLGGIRRNVICVEALTQTPDGIEIPQTIFRITLVEGVKLYLYAPETYTAEKTQAGLEKYFALSDVERTTGRIAVSEVNGELIVTYSAVDEFEK
ncbi:MAG: hypothetical protein IKA88_05135 [Clostridia bacterium]|nr:hypothetical protein [Clostridia bacterium]